ncbi:MAG: endonuclease/exonuclease/phosphatase family protein [Bacillota bacterium]|nr:endonuclease/exonuclease/phosphatase family protein [Bacillota bacterium]
MQTLLRIISYNIRHGRGIDGRVSLDRTIRTLTLLRPDLVAVQEVDRFRTRSGFRDQARILGEALGMNYVFGENRRFQGVGAYGNAVLSRFTIAKYSRTLLPGIAEQRSLLETWLDIDGLQVWLGCTHLGLNREERSGQVTAILKCLDRVRIPVILAGDFNCRPRASELQPVLRRFREVSEEPASSPTYPSTDPQKRLDYIFVSEPFRPEAVKVFASSASDHLPLYGDLAITSCWRMP